MPSKKRTIAEIDAMLEDMAGGSVNPRAQVLGRIEEIIKEINSTNMGGRSQNYIGGDLFNEDYMEHPEDGLAYHVGRAEGYDPEEMIAEQRKRQRMHGGCAASGRKKRSDAGKKRGPNEWIMMVKAVAAQEGIPYNEAMKVASAYRKQGYTLQDFQ